MGSGLAVDVEGEGRAGGIAVNMEGRGDQGHSRGRGW